MKGSRRLLTLIAGPAVALAVAATVLTAQERPPERGDRTGADRTGADRTGSDRFGASRNGGERGSRGRGFERRPTTSPTTMPAGADAAARGGSRANGSGAYAATRPAGAAPGAGAGTGKPLPEPYAILDKRSIFTRDRSRIAGAAREATPPPLSAPAPPARPEESFVLRGLSLLDNLGYTALVEDMAGQKTIEVKLGQRLARGQVVELSLDHLGYEHDGKLTRIAMGQNLDGQTVVTYTPPPVASASPTAGGAPTTQGARPPGAPGAAPAAPSAPLTGGGDLVEQMRRRRQQQTGG